MQNSRMIQMNYNLQMYNYRILHLKGSSNYITDVLSRCPVWINVWGKHLDVVIIRAKHQYLWPKMKQQVKEHVDKYQNCFAHKPSKSEALHRGLSIPLEDISPMDWLATDLMELKVKDKKMHLIVIVDRSSGFVTDFQLSGTKTCHLIAALQQFV